MSTYEWTIVILCTPIAVLFIGAAILTLTDQSPEGKAYREHMQRVYGYYTPNYLRRPNEEEENQ